MWLRVDPMSDERPSLSPYNYCQWNPVMLVDPTGMLDEEINSDKWESRSEQTKKFLSDHNFHAIAGGPQTGEDEKKKGVTKSGAARQLFYQIPVIGPTQESSDLLSEGDYLGATGAFGWAVLDVLLIGSASSIRLGVKSMQAAKGGMTAYETALAGGKHSGFLKNYIGRNADEINKAIRSMQTGNQGISVHLDKIANPTKYVPNWNTLRPGHQQSLIKGWQNTVTKHTEQIEILRGILGN